MEAAAEESAAPLHMKAEEREPPLHMEAAEESAAPLRTHSFLFGCVLKGAKAKVSFHGGGDDLQEQLTLRTASLGPGAPDVLHVLAVIGETQEGSRVPVATLRPSLLTSVYLGGMELTPPVTFWLVAGTGPLYISGQHLVALTEREAAAAKAAAKREAAHMEAAAEREAEQTLALEQMKEKLVSLTWDRIPQTIDKFRRFAHFILCADEPQIVQQLWEFVLSEKLNGPPQKPSLTLEQWKEKLVSLSRQGGRIPKTMDKFNKFVCNSSDMDDPQIVQQLWKFVLSKKLIEPPGIMHGSRSLHIPQLTVEQMKEKLVSVCLLEPGRFPKTFDEFLKLAYFTLDTDEPQIMQQMWEYLLSEGRLMIASQRLREEPGTAQAAVVQMSSAVNGTCIFNKLVCNAAVHKSQKDFLALPTSQSNHFGRPPSTEQNHPLAVEQMKEELVCLALVRGRIPDKIDKFRQFVHSTFHTDEPWIVNHLWRFTREKVKEAGTVSSWADD